MLLSSTYNCIHLVINENVIDECRFLLNKFKISRAIMRPTVWETTPPIIIPLVFKVVNVMLHVWSCFEQGWACLTRIISWVFNIFLNCWERAINFQNEFAVCYPIECSPVWIKIYSFVVPWNVTKGVRSSCISELSKVIKMKILLFCDSFGTLSQFMIAEQS